MSTQTEDRLARLIDTRETTTRLHESLLEANKDQELSQEQEAQAVAYRERMKSLDDEIGTLAGVVDADRTAAEQSKKIRRALSGNTLAEEDGDGVVYRTMAEYARDFVLTRNGQVADQVKALVGDKQEIERAAQRIELAKRTPANTLSSNVAGLTPAQHIAQIFQVINDSRPIVNSAQRTELVRGVLNYPSVDTSPIVSVQNTQKTEAGNVGMAISMVTATASTYLGGGDLSWQAINWSTPNALDMWFRLAGADYALKTEQDAAQAMQHSGFSNNISATIAASATFATWMTGIGAGYAEVFANSGRVANTLYIAPDVFGYLLGLTSNAFTQFMSVGQSGIGPLNIVVSRGMDAGVAVVGDSDGLLVAETAGAPVELRVVEPAIGGVEVGIIGAFEAVVVDDGSFAMITTAS